MARILNCIKLPITRLIQRYRVTGRTADRPRSGRPRVTTANEDRHVSILHLRNIFLTVTSSAATGLGQVISRHTVRRRLRQHGIRAYYRPFGGMTLTYVGHVSFNVGNIRTVPFSDESRFQLFRADGRTYRRAGERTALSCVQETVPFGGGHVMVWGGIRGQQRTDRIVIDANLTAHCYIDQVYVPSCYRSCNTNLEPCFNRTMPDLTQLSERDREKCFI